MAPLPWPIFVDLGPIGCWTLVRDIAKTRVKTGWFLMIPVIHSLKSRVFWMVTLCFDKQLPLFRTIPGFLEGKLFFLNVLSFTSGLQGRSHSCLAQVWCYMTFEDISSSEFGKRSWSESLIRYLRSIQLQVRWIIGSVWFPEQQKGVQHISSLMHLQ